MKTNDIDNAKIEHGYEYHLNRGKRTKQEKKVDERENLKPFNAVIQVCPVCRKVDVYKGDNHSCIAHAQPKGVYMATNNKQKELKKALNKKCFYCGTEMLFNSNVDNVSVCDSCYHKEKERLYLNENIKALQAKEEEVVERIKSGLLKKYHVDKNKVDTLEMVALGWSWEDILEVLDSLKRGKK